MKIYEPNDINIPTNYANVIKFLLRHMAYRKMLFENSILLCLLTTSHAINWKAVAEFPIPILTNAWINYALLLCY